MKSESIYVQYSDTNSTGTPYSGSLVLEWQVIPQGGTGNITIAIVVNPHNTSLLIADKLADFGVITRTSISSSGLMVTNSFGHNLKVVTLRMVDDITALGDNWYAKRNT